MRIQCLAMALHSCGNSFKLRASSSSSSFKSSSTRINAGFSMHITAGLEEILHNQILTNAAVAGFSAQLVKPLSSLVAGKGFNWRLVLRSGGMPSAHAASVAAAAFGLGLERGFSDSIFGFAAVMAGIVIYDAQGVRLEVGRQAEVINTLVFTQFTKPAESTAGAPVLQQIGKESSAEAFSRSSNFFQTAEKLPSMRDGEVTLQEIGNEDGWRHIPLKESVGHTKLQVLIGALFGASIAIITHSLLH